MHVEEISNDPKQHIQVSLYATFSDVVSNFVKNFLQMFVICDEFKKYVIELIFL